MSGSHYGFLKIAIYHFQSSKFSIKGTDKRGKISKMFVSKIFVSKIFVSKDFIFRSFLHLLLSTDIHCHISANKNSDQNFANFFYLAEIS